MVVYAGGRLLPPHDGVGGVPVPVVSPPMPEVAAPEADVSPAEVPPADAVPDVWGAELPLLDAVLPAVVTVPEVGPGEVDPAPPPPAPLATTAAPPPPLEHADAPSAAMAKPEAHAATRTVRKM